MIDTFNPSSFHQLDVESRLIVMTVCMCAGAVVIPTGHHFPGTALDSPQTQSPASRKPVFFATAGESGTVKIWSSATAQCVYEQKGPASTAGGNYIHLALMPGNAGLMAASADCNLLFLQPKVEFMVHKLCTTASCLSSDATLCCRELDEVAAGCHVILQQTLFCKLVTATRLIWLACRPSVPQMCQDDDQSSLPFQQASSPAQCANVLRL